MTTQEHQQELLASFLDAMCNHIKEVLNHAPSEWDGIEIRQMCADSFHDETLPMKGRRKNEYTRALASVEASVRNLKG